MFPSSFYPRQILQIFFLISDILLFSCNQLALCVSFIPRFVLCCPQKHVQEGSDDEYCNGDDSDKEEREETVATSRSRRRHILSKCTK